MATYLDNIFNKLKKNSQRLSVAPPTTGSVSVAQPKPLPPLSVSSSPIGASNYNPQNSGSLLSNIYNPQKTSTTPLQPAVQASTYQPSVSPTNYQNLGTLTLPSGQKISASDPNYQAYANQYGSSAQPQPIVSSERNTPLQNINTYKDNVTAQSVRSSTPTGVPTALPTSPDRTNLDQAYRDYISSLSPSTKTQKAYQDYLDYVANTSKAITGLEGQGRGIEAGLIRGQQEKEYRLRQPDEARMLAEYQGLTGEDQARQQALFANLGFVESQFKDQQKEYENQLARFEPTQIGDNIVKLNPDTGQYDVVYSTPSGGQELKTLSPGQTIYDPNTGQALFTAPSSQDPLDIQKKQLEIEKLSQEISGGGLSGIEKQIKELQLEKLQGEIVGAEDAKQKSMSNALYKATEAVTLIEDIFGRVNNASAGFLGGMTAGKKGTPAYNLAQDVNTLQATIGFDALQAMRDASLTGGALGQVSERELALLTSTLRSLDTGQSPEQLRTNLKKVKEHYNRAKALVYADRAGYNEQDFNNAVKSKGLDAVLQFFEQSGFNSVGGDTNQAVSIPSTSRLAYVNNNPGNLRFVGQQGATQGEGGFAKFSTPQDGYQALKNQISLDASRGLTLGQFINKYAPPIENNTSQYLQQVIKSTGASSNTPVKNINLDTLAKVIALKESSTRIA